MTPFRLAAFMSHPNQHFSLLFQRLARVGGIHLRTLYGCDWGVKEYWDKGFGNAITWDLDLLEGYEHLFMKPSRPPSPHQRFWELDNPEVTERLEEFQPHMIYLHGYGHRTAWRAARWGQHRCALIHCGDSELRTPRNWLVRAVKQVMIRWHFRRCDAFLTVGDQNEDYYRHYGVPESKLFRGTHPIDLRRLRAALQDPSQPTRDQLRATLRIPRDALVVIQVGKLQVTKRPQDLVEALGLLRDEFPQVYALYVGDGALRGEVERRAAELGIGDRVVITGFVNQRNLPAHFAAADIILSASETDPHAQVIAESTAVGLPVIASDRIGCLGPTDSARPDVNTLEYPCGNVVALANRIRQFATNADLRRRFGTASYRLAGDLDVDVAARGILRAILALRPNFPWWDAVSPAAFDEIRREEEQLSHPPEPVSA